MENIIFLEQKIREISNFQLELENNGGVTKNGNLFEKIITLEDVILEKFGIPNTPIYNKILSFNKIPSVIDIKKRIERLSLEAKNYLSQNTKSNIGILNDAQKFKQEWSEILPEIKVKTHIYTIFVFDKILLERKDNIENILNDLLFVESNFDTLDTLGKLEVGMITNIDQTIKHLKEIGVKYVDEYVEEFSIITRWRK